MGKTKGKRFKKRFNNPVGITSIKELEEDVEFMCSDFNSDNVESILQKLQSSATDEKECAAFTIANMADNPKFVETIIENKVIRIAGPLLVDRSLAVRHAIAGCLRNLAVCGGYPICQAMVDQDILTSLVLLLLEYKKPWTPTKSEEGIIDSRSEIFLEACNLLWSLCESSDTAVGIFNEKKLIKILLPCLNIDVYGLRIPLAVAQCLHTVGEENKEAIDELSEPLILEILKALMELKPEEPEHVLLKTLSAGIMINIMSGKVQSCMSAVISPIGEVVDSTLSEPIKPILLSLSQNIDNHKRERLNKYRDEKDVELKLNAVNKTSKTLDHLLQAKQISLEMIANIAVSSSDDWEDASCSGSSDDMETEFEETTEQVDLEMTTAIQSIILSKKLFEKTIEQIVIPGEMEAKVLSENPKGKEILKRLNTVRCRALLCLNNMVQALTVEDIGGPERLFKLWIEIAKLLFDNPDVLDDEQLDAITSSMRAVLQKLAEAKYSSQLENLQESDLKGLMDICNKTQVPAIKVNIIKSLGTIGYLIANSKLFQSCHNHIKVIGVFLLECCSKSPELWVQAESLDAIFDLFAEDHVDFIAVQINLVEKLKHIKKYLDSKRKVDLGEHSFVIKTAKTNLRRFIEYKIRLHAK